MTNLINKILCEGLETPPDSHRAIRKIDALENKYEKLGCAVDVTIMRGYLYLSSIKVTNKREGFGTKIMNELTSIADEYNLIITLTPSNSFGSSLTRLIKFYKRFGFRKKNPRRMEELALTGSMIREPQ